MLKIIIWCIISFAFFGWLPVFVGTFEATDIVLGGTMGIIIALLSFAIYEIRLLRKKMELLNQNDDKKDEQAK